MGALQYSLVRPALAQSNLTTVAQYMFWLMFRNVASDAFMFEDPVNAGVLSKPGCVLASPSWENSATQVRQDYVYNWTRDAAIVAIELAAGLVPTSQPLIDYVQFAQICQNSGGDFDRASFLINGTQRDWTDQTDGPALQTLAILRLFTQLDAPAQTMANAVIAANLNFLQTAYQGQTYPGTVPLDNLSAGFFSQIGVDAPTTPAAAAAALQSAGDQMLQAIVFHSDHLELSEQFDATSGYEKSVSNLSWSYASFLSAVRAKNAL